MNDREEIFNEIYETYYTFVFFWFRKHGNSIDDSEELTQNVFENIWQYTQLEQLKKDNLHGFLQKAARERGTALTKYRRCESRTVEGIERHRPHQIGKRPDEILQRKTVRTILEAVLETLSPWDKELITLRYFREWGWDDINRELGCNGSLSWQHKQKALRKLRMEFEGLGFNSLEEIFTPPQEPEALSADQLIENSLNVLV